MATDWTSNIPAAVYFIIGIGGFAGAILAIVKLWETVVPSRQQQFAKDVSTIKSDIQDIRSRVGMLELDIARIDQPSIARRFDGIEHKIDKLYDFLLERLTKSPP
ncbi:hypothetical protein [Bauldia litoralis]|uniref:Uncharacterized protein n=1 Tax=Bauldia litoralis TaxID=665467 RepID=A0A1G6EJC8_9HYPH|nr:hypothetical protein [Bauldia litoralis]SDB57482.1 hypothetical protein SAMN02982931_04567 [Bauldia litoralis]